MRRRFWFVRLVMSVILTILVILSNVSAQFEDFPELEGKTIFDYRVAYLIAEDAAEPDSIVSAETLNTALGAIAFTSWDDFIAAQTRQSFDVVFIHDSMKDQVDRDWTSVAYRKQIMFAGVNMRFVTLADIVDDLCIGGKRRDSRAINLIDYEDYSYLVFLYFPLFRGAQNPDAPLENCSTRDLDYLEIVYSHRGFMQSVPTIEEWEGLGFGLVLQLNEYEKHIQCCAVWDFDFLP